MSAAHPVFGAPALALPPGPASLLARLRRHLRRRRAAAELRSFDDRMLRDMGLHRSEIDAVLEFGAADRTRRSR